MVLGDDPYLFGLGRAFVPQLCEAEPVRAREGPTVEVAPRRSFLSRTWGAVARRERCEVPLEDARVIAAAMGVLGP